MNNLGGYTIALLTVKEIFDLVRDDLALVEEELARQSEAAFRRFLKSPRTCSAAGGSACASPPASLRAPCRTH